MTFRKMRLFTLLISLTITAFSQERPNIIFILVDDMGWSDIGCYGGEVKTPNIDKLANEGLRLTQMHNTAKCFPSRACLLTGVYAQQCGMSNGINKITNAVTLGEVLRSAGYRTLASGKHHSNESLYDRGFDHYFGLRDGACNFFNPGLQRPGEAMPAQKRYGKRTWVDDEKVMQPYTPVDKKFYTTDAFTDKALSYLDEYKDEEKPFFLYLAYNAPHDPLQAWPEDIAKYKDTYKLGYKNIRDARLKKMAELGVINPAMKLPEPTHQDWDSLNPKERETESLKMAIYAAMIDRVDQNIGRLLEKLETIGKRKNTLIMFSSDNGSSYENAEKNVKKNDGELGSAGYWASLGVNWANVSNTPYQRGKNSSHEGGICSPFIVHWPKNVPQNKIDAYPSHFIDIMPTLVELTGAKYPKKHLMNTEVEMPVTPMQGISLLPLFKGQSNQERSSPLFWQWSTDRAVRVGDWKLYSDNYQNWQLFDMNKDRNETTDLSEDYPEKTEQLKNLYDQWAPKDVRKKPRKIKKKKQS